LIAAAVARIEDDSFHLVRSLDAARPQDWFDDFAHVHHGDEIFVTVVQEREVGEEADAIDRQLTRPCLRANRPALAPERDCPADARVFRKLIELRDIRESHIRPVIWTQDRPIFRERDRRERGEA